VGEEGKGHKCQPASKLAETYRDCHPVGEGRTRVHKQTLENSPRLGFQSLASSVFCQREESEGFV
jgi:hypothetical protein